MLTSLFGLPTGVSGFSTASYHKDFRYLAGDNASEAAEILQVQFWELI